MGWLRALRWPDFRRVWFVGSLMQFGYWFASISFQWLVARATDNDPLALSVLYFCVLAPMLLFSLPAGALADIRDRRRIIAVAQAGVIAVSLITGALALFDAAPAVVVMVCGFVAGTMHTMAVPANHALVAVAVPSEDLRHGILMQSAGINLARIAGPPAASLIILLFGVANSLFAYGVIGLATLLTTLGVRTASTPGGGSTEDGLLVRIRSGFDHVRTHPPAGAALTIVAIASIFGLSYSAQLPALAARVSPDPSAFLALASVASVGSFAGVILAGLPRSAAPSVSPAAAMLGLQAAVVAGLAFAREFWVVMALLVLGGVLQFGIMTSCNAVLQAVVDDEHRGRVSSLYILCWGGLLPVGGLLLGVLWRLFGATPALVSCAAVVLAVAVALLAPRSPRTRPA